LISSDAKVALDSLDGTALVSEHTDDVIKLSIYDFREASEATYPTMQRTAPEHKVSDGFGGDDQANVMAVVAKLPNPCNDLTGEVRIDGRRRDIDTVRMAPSLTATGTFPRSYGPYWRR
jgi:hypothetical protein